MNNQEIISLLSLQNPAEIKELFTRAYKIKLEHTGKKVFLRGLIELSNICSKNCYYCGIRRDNKNVQRFAMTLEEITESAAWSWKNGYGSVVLQSGEQCSADFSNLMETAIKTIKKQTNNELAITLSLGEQTRETYKRWLAAGADRYLLRIETSNRELYAKLHPSDHDFETRLNCLKTLQDLGYQLGTGVMIGLPWQTLEHLAEDILFFKNMDVDMIGMGPYIPHHDTPLAAEKNIPSPEESLELGLKMIAVTRIALKDVNIASTTALQTLSPTGREMGLQAGANVIMPNVTDKKYRSFYKLYDNKPCLDENATQCRACLENRIKSIGEEIAYFEPGTPFHFKKRTHQNNTEKK